MRRTQHRRIVYAGGDEAVFAQLSEAFKVRRAFVDHACGWGELQQCCFEHDYAVLILGESLSGQSEFGERVAELIERCPELGIVVILAQGVKVMGESDATKRAIVGLVESPWDMDDVLDPVQRALDLYDRRTRVGQRTLPALTASARPILMIEDDDEHAELIAHYLTQSDPSLEPRRVASLREALDLLHESRFDVILSDLALPDARGIDCVSRLREAAPNAAVVVLSSLDDENLALQAVETGAQDYLVKSDIDARSLARALKFAEERKMAQRDLADLAHHDPLTGLANRLALRGRLRHELRQAQSGGTSLAVLYLDVDKFKSVNDRLGHACGDELLRAFAARLRQATRDCDLVVRMGGDEFVVVMPRAAEGDPEQVALRILELLTMPFQIADHCLEVSASVGVAMFDDSIETIGQLLERADRAMYAAKAAGRNCYRVAGADAVDDGSNALEVPEGVADPLEGRDAA